MLTEQQTNQETNRTELIDNIKKEILTEMEFYGASFGEITYRLAKALYEKTKNLSISETHSIYEYVSDYLGMSIKTIKTMVWLYGKLAKYNVWHTGTNLFKFRLFQLAYYISKKVSDFDLVFQKVYAEIISNFKMLVWVEKASYKELIEWVKTRFETHFKVYSNKGQLYVNCDLCNVELKAEDKGKRWDYVPLHFTCYEMLKENSKDKIAILRNKIIKEWKTDKIRELEQKLTDAENKLSQVTEELDRIKSKRKRKLKQLVS